MDELEIKVIDACRKYVQERNGSYVDIRCFNKKLFDDKHFKKEVDGEILIECVQSSFPSIRGDNFTLRNKILGIVAIRDEKNFTITSEYDKNFAEYINRELNS